MGGRRRGGRCWESGGLLDRYRKRFSLFFGGANELLDVDFVV